MKNIHFKAIFSTFSWRIFLHHHELCKMLRLFCPFTTVKFSAILGLFSRQVAKDMQKRRLFGLLLAFSKLSTLKTMHFVVLLSSFQIEYQTSNQATSHFGNNSGWMTSTNLRSFWNCFSLGFPERVTFGAS